MGVDSVRLRNCGRGAWVADRELRLAGGVVLPIRMVLLENEVGRLICYSPVELDSGTVEAVAGLGQVDVIVVPNRFHTLFLDAAHKQFPAAKVIVPPSHLGIAGRPPHGAREPARQRDRDVGSTDKTRVRRTRAVSR